MPCMTGRNSPHAACAKPPFNPGGIASATLNHANKFWNPQ